MRGALLIIAAAFELVGILALAAPDLLPVVSRRNARFPIQGTRREQS